MDPQIWTVIGTGIVVIAFQWRMYTALTTRIDNLQRDMSDVKERLSRIEGWIAGRFGEQAV